MANPTSIGFFVVPPVAFPLGFRGGFCEQGVLHHNKAREEYKLHRKKVRIYFAKILNSVQYRSFWASKVIINSIT